MRYVGKKMPRFNVWAPLILVLAGPALLVAPGAARSDQPTLTVVSWGGAYEAAQRQALFEPFTKLTGIKIRVATYDGGLNAVRARAKEHDWDVVDMLEGQAIAACEEGMLSTLNAKAVTSREAPPLGSDLRPARLRKCSLPQSVYATVMAYDDRAFPGLKPTKLDDFFDLERFPGKRAIEKRPDVILEWALMAEGVPPSQVYDLLSTDRGLRLAFRRLTSIRDAIVWWESADEAARLLGQGAVAMASGYNGRFFSAAREHGQPISIVWDGRLLGYDVWAILKSSKKSELAEQFLRFATAPDSLARLAERIPYGPARRSALERIGHHPRLKIPMRDHMPNAPRHDNRGLVRDSRWYAHTQALRQRRFSDWLADVDEKSLR